MKKIDDKILLKTDKDIKEDTKKQWEKWRKAQEEKKKAKKPRK